MAEDLVAVRTLLADLELQLKRGEKLTEEQVGKLQGIVLLLEGRKGFDELMNRMGEMLYENEHSKEFKVFFLFTAMDPGEKTEIKTITYHALNIACACERAEWALNSTTELRYFQLVGAIRVLSEEATEMVGESLYKK